MEKPSTVSFETTKAFCQKVENFAGQLTRADFAVVASSEVSLAEKLALGRLTQELSSATNTHTAPKTKRAP